MIKRMLQVGLILAGSIAMPSWAIVIGSTEVGAEDTLIAQTSLASSGEDVELAWVQTILSDPTVTFSGKTELGGTGSEFITDGTLSAFNLVTDPSHFLLKLGGGGTANTDTHFLYENLDDIGWAVFNLSDITTATLTRISHISEFDGGGNGVPEPSILGLLGIGLLGIALGRRRMAA